MFEYPKRAAYQKTEKHASLNFGPNIFPSNLIKIGPFLLLVPSWVPIGRHCFLGFTFLVEAQH